MPKIEIDPLNIPQAEYVGIVAPHLEQIIQRRGGTSDTSIADGLGISSTAIKPSDFLPGSESDEAFYEEHRSHLRYLGDIGIEATFPVREKDGSERFIDLPKLVLFGSLLTERNLPQYQSAMQEQLARAALRNAPGAEVFRAWYRQWTTEEQFHADALRDSAYAMRIISRKEHDQETLKLSLSELRLGDDDIESLVELAGYLTGQEAATVVSHSNGGKVFGADFRKTSEKIARNEKTHCDVNTELARLSLQIDTDHTVQALWRRVRQFVMPGENAISFFDVYKKEMAVAGLFDYAALRKIWQDKADQLGLASLPLSGRADEYRHKLFGHIDGGSKINQKIDSGLERLRQERIESAKARGAVPFILDRTVEVPWGKPAQLVA